GSILTFPLLIFALTSKLASSISTFPFEPSSSSRAPSGTDKSHRAPIAFLKSSVSASALSCSSLGKASPALLHSQLSRDSWELTRSNFPLLNRILIGRASPAVQAL